MEETRVKRLTEGPIVQALMQLALPIMASSFLSTAYSLTDMAWIGSLGATAVAGVGMGGMYVWLSNGVCMLARMGGQVHVAQSLGRGNREEACAYAASALQLTIVMGILYGILTVLFTDPLLSFFGMGDDYAMECARVYMRITCGLIVCSFVNLTLTGLYTAQGDSRTPLKANLVGLILNMILDPLLILGIGPFPRLETTGAAVATVLSQMVVLIVLVRGIRKGTGEDNILRGFNFVKPIPVRYFTAIVKLGTPAALQETAYCMISMVLTRMVAVFGPGAVATQRVGGHIESLTWNTAEGFSSALNAFCGQNYGAGKMNRVRKGYRMSVIALGAWGLFIAVLFWIFPEQISRVFFHEADVIPLAMDYLVIIGLSEPFMCVEILSNGAISGLGNTRVCSAISIVLTGLRIPLALLLGRTSLGLNGIWWALTVTSMMKGCVLFGAFQRQCKICEHSLEGKKHSR